MYNVDPTCSELLLSSPPSFVHFTDGGGIPVAEQWSSVDWPWEIVTLSGETVAVGYLLYKKE